MRVEVLRRNIVVRVQRDEGTLVVRITRPIGTALPVGLAQLVSDAAAAGLPLVADGAGGVELADVTIAELQEATAAAQSAADGHVAATSAAHAASAIAFTPTGTIAAANAQAAIAEVASDAAAALAAGLAGKSDTGHTHSFAALTGKPTTLDGYGILDAATADDLQAAASAASSAASAAAAAQADVDELADTVADVQASTTSAASVASNALAAAEAAQGDVDALESTVADVQVAASSAAAAAAAAQADVDALEGAVGSLTVAGLGGDEAGTPRPPSGTAGGSLTGTYPNPTIAEGAVGGTEIAAALKDPAGGTAGLRTLGTGAQQAAPGNDPRFRELAAPATIACLGDSLSVLCSIVEEGTPTKYTYHGFGFLTWTQVFLRQRLHFEHALNFGAGGETAAEIAARVGDVVAAAPSICVVEGGGNDAIAQLPAETTIAALQTIYETLIAAGILVVTLPILPQGSTWWAVMDPEAAEVQRARVNRINRWIRRYSREHPGIVMADPNGALVDLAASDSAAIAELFSADWLHPGYGAAMLIGQKVAEAIEAYAPPGSPNLPEHNIDVFAAENPEGNLLVNGCMLGTGGSATTDVTGDVADSWEARRLFGSAPPSGTIVASKAPRTDGVEGEWQVLTLAGLNGGGDSIWGLRQEVAGSLGYYDQGDTIECECEIEVEGAEYVKSVSVIVREYNGSGSVVTAAESGLGTNGVYAPEKWSGVYRTPAMPLAAELGTSSKLQLDVQIRVAADLGASVVVRVGRVDLRRVL